VVSFCYRTFKKYEKVPAWENIYNGQEEGGPVSERTRRLRRLRRKILQIEGVLNLERMNQFRILEI
jgi:hypothetical protein